MNKLDINAIEQPMGIEHALFVPLKGKYKGQILKFGTKQGNIQSVNECTIDIIDSIGNDRICEFPELHPIYPDEYITLPAVCILPCSESCAKDCKVDHIVRSGDWVETRLWHPENNREGFPLTGYIFYDSQKHVWKIRSENGSVLYLSDVRIKTKLNRNAIVEAILAEAGEEE